MVSLKHVGRVKNTGRRCVVVFREIYDTDGNVIDEDNCLLFETDSLPDADHQDIIRIIESEPAQRNDTELFDILARTKLSSGVIALSWLANTNRLRKFPTSNVELTPDSRTTISLDQLNKIVRMQKQGMSQHEIENSMNDENATSPDIADTQTGNEGVFDDTAMAESNIKQAEMFEEQAANLRSEAYKLDPSLKPRRATKKKSEPANKKA